MLLLTEMLAEEYMKTHPGASVYVGGGGSAAGIKSLIRGEIDICTSSRTLKATEVKLLAEQYGNLGMATIIGKDGLSIYINTANPVKNFTIDQLKDIFTGKIKNWKELGGENAEIKVVTRNPNSGTYLYFKEHILNNEEYSDDALVLPTTESVINYIRNEKYSVGYGGIGYGDESLHASVNNIKPTDENVRNDNYPINRYLYFYTLTTPEGIVKNFIDWVLSPDGQRVIKNAGYVPVWEIPF
ncbi:MAG: phosphate ABC transporter substrate-binding protein [Ignavibacteriaceae bacterium]